jgi:hypothetical protein
MTLIDLFPPSPGRAFLLTLDTRTEAEGIVRRGHYTHSIPSGKSHWFAFEAAVVVFSIPANRFAASIVLGRDAEVWELTRLYAPPGHGWKKKIVGTSIEVDPIQLHAELADLEKKRQRVAENRAKFAIG